MDDSHKCSETREVTYTCRCASGHLIPTVIQSIPMTEIGERMTTSICAGLQVHPTINYSKVKWPLCFIFSLVQPVMALQRKKIMRSTPAINSVTMETWIMSVTNLGIHHM